MGLLASIRLCWKYRYKRIPILAIIQIGMAATTTSMRSLTGIVTAVGMETGTDCLMPSFAKEEGACHR